MMNHFHGSPFMGAGNFGPAGFSHGAPFGSSGIAPFGNMQYNGQSNMQYSGQSMQYNGYQNAPANNMTSAITNQKPKKVIYIDLNGNQKVFSQREDGDGYVEDVDDERNRNPNAVKPILDVENYDGFNYHPATDELNASQSN